MCCCGTPVINGEPGYKWGYKDKPSVRPVNPPPTAENILFDEPGRCGGQDSHCHHYRVVGSKTGACFPSLLVRNGSGDVTIRLSNGKAVVQALSALDSNGRYWLLNALFHAQADAAQTARTSEAARWRQAAAEGRIKVRKVRGQSVVRVEVHDAPRP